jgi:hypothetical protein
MQDALEDVIEILQKYNVKFEINKAQYTSSIYIKIYKPRRKTIYETIRISDHFSNNFCSGYYVDTTSKNARLEIGRAIADITKIFNLRRLSNA